jgi:hypothetical protein
MPDKKHHHEENARLLSVYFRPWCLHAADANVLNPLLTELSSSHRQAGAEKATGSYASAWSWYTSGNIVSEGARRYITNVLNMTAACAKEKPEDASSNSSDSETDEEENPLGGMDLVARALEGRVREDGQDDITLGFGKHSTAIGLAKTMWASPERTAEEMSACTEKVFPDSSFPKGDAITRTLQKIRQKKGDRPKPFRGYTEPYCTLTVTAYQKRTDEWFVQVREKAATLTFTAKAFEDFGVVLETASGKVTRLASEGLFHAARVHVGWCIEAVDGRPYTAGLLEASVGRGASVQVTFQKDVPGGVFVAERYQAHKSLAKHNQMT